MNAAEPPARSSLECAMDIPPPALEGTMKTTFPVYGIIRQTNDETLICSPWLDADEAASYCGYESGETIRAAVRRGELEPDNDGQGKMMFHRATLDQFRSGGAPVVQSPASAPASGDESIVRADNELEEDRRSRNLQEHGDQREVQDRHDSDGPGGEPEAATENAPGGDDGRSDRDARADQGGDPQSGTGGTGADGAASTRRFRRALGARRLIRATGASDPKRRISE